MAARARDEDWVMCPSCHCSVRDMGIDVTCPGCNQKVKTALQGSPSQPSAPAQGVQAGPKSAAGGGRGQGDKLRSGLRLCKRGESDEQQQDQQRQQQQKPPRQQQQQRQKEKVEAALKGPPPLVEVAQKGPPPLVAFAKQAAAGPHHAAAGYPPPPPKLPGAPAGLPFKVDGWTLPDGAPSAPPLPDSYAPERSHEDRGAGGEQRPNEAYEDIISAAAGFAGRMPGQPAPQHSQAPQPGYQAPQQQYQQQDPYQQQERDQQPQQYQQQYQQQQPQQQYQQQQQPQQQQQQYQQQRYQQHQYQQQQYQQQPYVAQQGMGDDQPTRDNESHFFSAYTAAAGATLRRQLEADQLAQLVQIAHNPPGQQLARNPPGQHQPPGQPQGWSAAQPSSSAPGDVVRQAVGGASELAQAPAPAGAPQGLHERAAASTTRTLSEQEEKLLRIQQTYDMSKVHDADQKGRITVTRLLGGEPRIDTPDGVFNVSKAEAELGPDWLEQQKLPKEVCELIKAKEPAVRPGLNWKPAERPEEPRITPCCFLKEVAGAILDGFDKETMATPQVVIDCTLGDGQISKHILKAAPNVDVVAFDADNSHRAVAQELIAASGRLCFLHQKYSFITDDKLADPSAHPQERLLGNADRLLHKCKKGEILGFVIDAGCTRWQHCAKERNMCVWPSWDYPRVDAQKLDMRLDQSDPGSVTAADVLNHCPPAELLRLCSKRTRWEQSEAAQLVGAIVEKRKQILFEHTGQLSHLIAEVAAGGTEKRDRIWNNFTRALQHHINEDLYELGIGIRAGFDMVKPGGRVVVLGSTEVEWLAVRAACSGLPQHQFDVVRPTRDTAESLAKQKVRCDRSVMYIITKPQPTHPPVLGFTFTDMFFRWPRRPVLCSGYDWQEWQPLLAKQVAPDKLRKATGGRGAEWLDRAEKGKGKKFGV